MHACPKATGAPYSPNADSPGDVDLTILNAYVAYMCSSFEKFALEVSVFYLHTFNPNLPIRKGRIISSALRLSCFPFRHCLYLLFDKFCLGLPE